MRENLLLVLVLGVTIATIVLTIFAFGLSLNAHAQDLEIVSDFDVHNSTGTYLYQAPVLTFDLVQDQLVQKEKEQRNSNLIASKYAQLYDGCKNK